MCTEGTALADGNDLVMHCEFNAAGNRFFKYPGGGSGAADIGTGGTPVTCQGFNETGLALLLHTAAGALFIGGAGDGLPVMS